MATNASLPAVLKPARLMHWSPEYSLTHILLARSNASRKALNFSFRASGLEAKKRAPSAEPGMMNDVDEEWVWGSDLVAVGSELVLEGAIAKVNQDNLTCKAKGALGTRASELVPTMQFCGLPIDAS